MKRKIGEEIELEFLLNPFKVSTVLLAKAQRADTEGLKPYLKRIKINLEKGSESIYVIAFPKAFSFFGRLFIKSIESDERLFVKKVVTTTHSKQSLRGVEYLKIAILARNDIYSDELFNEKLKSLEISEGMKIRGIVEDVFQNESSVTVLGLNAYISKDECSWNNLKSCSECLVVGKEYEFISEKR